MLLRGGVLAAIAGAAITVAVSSSPSFAFTLPSPSVTDKVTKADVQQVYYYRRYYYRPHYHHYYHPYYHHYYHPYYYHHYYHPYYYHRRYLLSTILLDPITSTRLAEFSAFRSGARSPAVWEWPLLAHCRHANRDRGKAETLEPPQKRAALAS